MENSSLATEADYICLSRHFKKRYKERVSKSSKNMLSFAKKAYYLGNKINMVDDADRRTYLQKRAGYTYAGVCRVYRGFVCWYNRGKAITIYPVPIIRQFKKGVAYENS